MKRSFLAASAAFGVLATAGAAAAQEPIFSQMVVFGDSLSDTGNVATLNGLADLNSYTTNPAPVTVEVVASNYGFSLAPSLKGGTNSAYGGAGYVNNSFGTPASIPTLTSQVNSYLAANPRLDPKALFTLFGGGNDVNFAGTNLVLETLTLAQAQANMTAAGNQAIALISALQAAGAETIIVANAPDVGLTPSARGADAISPGSSARITALAQTLNTTLNAGLVGRRGIVPVNAFQLLQEVVSDKEAFGLTDVTNTACTTSSSLTCTTSTLKAANADQTWLFADGIHPTGAGHAIFGDYILAELAAPQQISLLAEEPLGIASTARDAIALELTDTEARTRTFVDLSLTNQNFAAQNDIRDSDASGGVITVGGLLPLNVRTALGAAVTHARTDTDFGGDAGRFETDATLITLFGHAHLGKAGYLAAHAQGGRLAFNEIERRIVLGGNLRSEVGSTDGRSRSYGVSGGWWFGGEGLRHGPVGAVTYSDVRVDGYAEDGSTSTAMTFGDQRRESVITEAGWALRGAMESYGLGLTPFASVTYNVEGRDDDRRVGAGLVTMNGTFDMSGFTPDDEWVGVRLGTGVDIGAKAAFTAGYSGRFGDTQDAHAVTVGVNMRY